MPRRPLPRVGDPALNNHIVFHAFTMANLAGRFPDMARNFIDHPITDETGLKGLLRLSIGLDGQAHLHPGQRES